MRRLILLIFVGWLPPYLCPSDAFLCLGARVWVSSERPRGLRQTGAAPLALYLLIYTAGFTSCAMAHMKEASSLATAVTATFGFFPRAVSLRKRLQSLS